MPTNETILADVKQKIFAADGDTASRRENWEKYYKIYRNYRDDLAVMGRSNLGLPVGFEWVEVVRARLYQKFAGKRPYVRVKGREPMDESPARGIQIYQNYQYDLADYKRFIYDVLSQVLIYGTGIGKRFWKYEEAERWAFTPSDPYDSSSPMMREKKTVVTYDNVAFELVDLFDFRVDPEATTIGDARWCAHRVYRTVDYLEKMAKLGIYYNIKDLVREVEEGSSGTTADANKIGRLQVEGHDATKSGTVKPIECWEYCDENNVFVVANGKYVIRNEKNEYGEKPYEVGKIISTPHEFYGIGLIEIGGPSARLMEDLMNSAMDNISFSVNKMFVVDENRIEDSELQSRPGGMIHVSGDVNSALRELEFTNVAADITNILAVVNDFSKRSTGVNDYLTGSADRRATATEASLLTNQAAKRIDMHIEEFGNTFVRPLAEAVHRLNSRFVTTEKVLRVTGTARDPYETVKITPEMFGANVDFVWENEDAALEDMVAVQQLVQALSIAQTNPTLMMFVPIIFSKILEKFGLHENDELMKAAVAAKNLVPIQVEMMMTGGMGMGGGGGLPNAQKVPTESSSAKQSAQKKSEPQFGSINQVRG